MVKQTIRFSDNYHPYLKDIATSEFSVPRGRVQIYDKLPNGNLKILHKSNMIVFQGREWLLQRAFGPELQGADENYDKYIKWFGIGTGGGEPGNPLQAGSTRAWDTDLIEPLVINPYVDINDPRYAPREVGGVQLNGYHKQFSSVVRKEDPANGYLLENKQFYPELIAEIRIEISSEDCNGPSGSGYADINEAALFVDNPDIYSPSSSSALVDSLSVNSIINLGGFTNQVKYIFDDPTDITDVLPGDRLTVTNSLNTENDVRNVLITDVGYQSSGCLAYVIVENTSGINEGSYPSGSHITNAVITMRSQPSDISMFSRITFSSIRKTIDRELVFLWKIYF